MGLTYSLGEDKEIIYYVGLLAGKNDRKLLNKTKNGRDINRHYYTKEEIKKEIKRDVVKKIFKLCKLRNTHIAFQRSYKLLESPKNIVEILWTNKKESLKLIANFENYKLTIIKNDQRSLLKI